MMSSEKSNKGALIAFIVIACWTFSIISLMNWEFKFDNPLLYLFILVQMHLYTGLFITAHDAMHGTVSANRRLNNAIGQICTALYACFPYKVLNTKHHEHHRYVHTEKDPDYSEGNFFVWYLSFIKQYLSWWQVVLMAIIFNILKIWIPESNLFFFWVLPSLLSTLQLFYFGTWLPHHGEHNNKHQSGSQRKNHVLAFLTCYFFGYHYEHHDSPGTPWWRLWEAKNLAD
ncbi:fatty acid desaturase [Daejeonella sp.]|uniref:fatty acid desaturase n=1 Tax=Daejeonella sp. TaxID=2805397 RepID=UPI0025BDDBD0|nr:fatty acid desaturase [Daejeonella sp.]